MPSSCCAGTAALEEGGIRLLAGVRRAVGRERDVGLGGAAGEDVEGRVDGDFEMSAFRGILGVGFGEAHDDLEIYVSLDVTCSGVGGRHTLIQ